MFQVATICLQRRESFVPAKNMSSATARRFAACIATCMSRALNDCVALLRLAYAVSHHTQVMGEK